MFAKGDSSNGAEALSHVLELVRKHQVRGLAHPGPWVVCGEETSVPAVERW